MTNIDQDRQSADRLLSAEIAGLEELKALITGERAEDFHRAVALVDSVKGRVIVSGMGKSGHIGRKIAATMASTGTPAQFVHPGEASHGDLGMVTRDDVVILISNSGETGELGDILNYTRRYSIPMIGITKNPDSSLGQASDVLLPLPKVDEACPMRLAPTTSTTMTLALGDALAVAVLERKGFEPADFKRFHPGGSLGNQLLRVRDLMHDALPLVQQDAGMQDALIEMSAKSFGCVGVIDADGKLLGIITDGDLRRHMRADLLDQQAASVMTADPRVIQPAELATEALGIMNEKGITSLFVVEDQKPVGLLHIHDCLRAGIA